MRLRHQCLGCRPAVFAVLVLGAGGVSVNAQGLEGLKKGYEEEVGKTVLPLREGYRKALLTLEQSLAGKGDYRGAGRVQEERRALEKLLGRVGPAAVAGVAALVADGRVKLRGGGAGTGGVREESGAWTGWQTAGDAVRWTLPMGIKGGGYALELVYRSAGAGVLPLAVKEDFHGLTRFLKVSAAPATGGTVRIGVLRVRPGATMLEIKLAAAGTLPDFRLLEVHLIPGGGEP